MKGKISEVFSSLQGEGVYLGKRQIFVRFFGCNLNCAFCDTKQSSFFEYEPQELLEEILMYETSVHSLSFTGGEPLLQPEFLNQALTLARARGFKNYLETNGTLAQELEQVIDNVDIIAMDFKFPSSTQGGDLWELHRKFLKVATRKEVFLKAVVCQNTSDEDLEVSLRLIKEINPALLLVLQPNSHESRVALKEKLNDFMRVCLKENVSVSVIPQMHKLMRTR